MTPTEALFARSLIILLRIAQNDPNLIERKYRNEARALAEALRDLVEDDYESSDR